MIIRDAKEADLPVIVDIYNAAIPSRMSTADTALVSVEFKRGWFSSHTPDQRPIWVAEEDGKVVAWFSFESFHGRPGYRPTAEVSIYVAPTHRRHEIGRWLLKEAVQQSPKFGLSTLLAFVFGHNAPSLKLFESAGFERWGLLPKVANLDGVERDLVILGLRVDGAEQQQHHNGASA